MTSSEQVTINTLAQQIGNMQQSLEKLTGLLCGDSSFPVGSQPAKGLLFRMEECEQVAHSHIALHQWLLTAANGVFVAVVVLGLPPLLRALFR
jgi:hypothetical protein